MKKENTKQQLISTLAGYIDHTLLYPDASTDDIVKLCVEAAQYKFFAVCVNPYYVKRAVRELASTQVAVATVVGFPLGADITDIKIAQAQRALFEGAEELDMVINIGALKERDVDYVLAEIQAIVRAAGEHKVKVIIECNLLTEEEKILATQLCAKAGAAMVKTCTGFVKDDPGVTVEDIKLLKTTIDNGKNIYSQPLQIKASGGIKDYNHALALIEAGAARLGTSSSVNIIKEISNKDTKNKGTKMKKNRLAVVSIIVCFVIQSAIVPGNAMPASAPELASAEAPAQAADQTLENNPAFKKGEELYARLKLKEAAEQYREAARQLPDNARIHERLGAVLAADEDYETAILEEQTAVKLDPKYFLPHVILGQTYANQDKMDLALEEFKQAVALKPSSFRALLDLGYAYTHLGKLDDAITTYKAAADLKPDDPTSHLNLGVVYSQKQDYDSAIKEEEKAIAMNSNVSEAYINLGNVYADTGKTDQAIEQFKKALKLNPTHPNALSALGWMYEKQGNYRAAVTEQRKALKACPTFSPAHRRLAVSLCKLDQDKEAMQEFEEALKLTPQDVTARVEYAHLLEKNDKPKEALEQYKKALAINPDVEAAKEGVEKLDKK